MDLDVKAKLLMGLDITIHDITIKNYTIGELFKDVGLTKYLQLSSVAIRKVRDYIRPEYLETFDDVHIFDIYCMSREMNELFIAFLNLLTGYSWKFVHTDVFVEFYAKNEHDKNVHVNKDNIEDIFEIIKIMYCLDSSKRESDRDDINDEMRELLREFEEEESKVKNAKGCNITLVSIIDGISSKHPSINLLNIWEYKMYQVMHTYYSLNKIDNENRMMTGIYSGTIDGKKVEMEKAHWANEV